MRVKHENANVWDTGWRHSVQTQLMTGFGFTAEASQYIRNGNLRRTTSVSNYHIQIFCFVKIWGCKVTSAAQSLNIWTWMSKLVSSWQDISTTIFHTGSKWHFLGARFLIYCWRRGYDISQGSKWHFLGVRCLWKEESEFLVYRGTRSKHLRIIFGGSEFSKFSRDIEPGVECFSGLDARWPSGEIGNWYITLESSD